MKKFVSLALALVLLLSICAATALAAKPTAKLTSGGGKYIKRGKAITLTYRLKSGSYTKQGSKWRSRFGTYVCYRSADGRIYAQKAAFFTGNINYKLKWNVPRSIPTGKYVNLYGTQYLSGRSWYVNTAKTAPLYIY